MTDQTPSTEDVRHHLVEIEPSDSICHECSTFDGSTYTDTVEWPCPVETRDREVAAKAIRRLARNLDTAMLFMNIDEEQALSDAMLDHADRIGAGDE